MGRKPEFNDIEGESDPVGDATTRQVQKLGRVDIPDEYLDNLGVEYGDDVFVVCDEDEVRIVKASAERVMNNVRRENRE